MPVATFSSMCSAGGWWAVYLCNGHRDYKKVAFFAAKEGNNPTAYVSKGASFVPAVDSPNFAGFAYDPDRQEETALVRGLGTEPCGT